MAELPLTGVRVVEAALGTTQVGCGPATGLPGAILRGLGAEVSAVRTPRSSRLDAGVRLDAAWDAGKEVTELAADEAAERVRELAAGADVLILTGAEELVERQGLAYSLLAQANPRLVHVRIRPSIDARGPLPDLDLLVAARAGVSTQIRAHRPGPAFPDLAIGSAGAALVATVGALAGLYEREATGRGGWFETSLLDGVHALLPMIMGRVENHSGATRLLWERQGPGEALAYRCADGGYVQLWFGAKGAYEAFLEHMDEPPSEKGYQADLMSGAMAERDVRWQARFAEHDRDWWLKSLAGQDFRVEPVLQPGEAMLEPDLRALVEPLVRVTAHPASGKPAAAGRLLEGVRVLDLSAYLAGPVGARVLADLGADVVKVEPPTGDVHRGMEPMFAAGQQRKRAVALDLKTTDLSGLFRWADVVHHNSRVGLDKRLGYDEEAVRAANPAAVYCHASGFGATGPRALLPANDQLMQALAGIEAGQGGEVNAPTYLVWGAIDTASGWVAASGIIAGLYARRRTGAGQSVATSLLGAAMALKPAGGPVLDAAQTGYGEGYRIAECADGWVAVAALDDMQFGALAGTDFARPVADVVAGLRAAGVPVEPVPDVDRTAFVNLAVDDPVGRQLGRVSTFAWGDRGLTEVLSSPLRTGPEPLPRRRSGIPGLGEHTDEVLAEVR